MDGGGERRQELRRLTARFLVAVSLNLFTGAWERAAGFNRSDPPNPETKNGHVAFYWASMFNRMAHLSFLLVIWQINITPLSMVVVERMRRIREDCDLQLLLGLICVMISFSFSAYLRWFVVVCESSETMAEGYFQFLYLSFFFWTLYGFLIRRLNMGCSILVIWYRVTRFLSVRIL